MGLKMGVVSMKKVYYQKSPNFWSMLKFEKLVLQNGMPHEQKLNFSFNVRVCPLVPLEEKGIFANAN